METVGRNTTGEHPVAHAVALLEERHPHVQPNALWLAWARSVQEEKVRQLQAALASLS